MKQLADLLANIVGPGPQPGAKPTRLLTQSSIQPRTYGERPIMSNKMTRDTLSRIILEVENDPLAGMGAYTKRDILVDRLLAHWNTVDARPVEQPTTPKPVITEPTKPQPTSMTPVTGKPVTGPSAIPQNAKVG